MASDRVGKVLQLGKHGTEIAKKRAINRKKQTADILHQLQHQALENPEVLASAKRGSISLKETIIKSAKSHGVVGFFKLPFRIFPSSNYAEKRVVPEYDFPSHDEEGDTALFKAGISTELEKALEEVAAEEEEEKEEEEEGLSKLEVALLFCLIFSLFFPDIWDYCNFPVEEDYIRNTVIIILFVIFCGEIVMICMDDHFYFGSTFFYLDLIGTLVLALDTSWIINLISNGSSVSILRATRASKIGVRSKEVFKLMVGSLRILRVIHPLMHAALKGFRIEWFHEKPKEKKGRLTQEQLIIRDDIEGKQVEVTEAFAFRIAGIVMVLIIIVPFLQNNVIDFSPNSWMTVMRVAGKTNTTTINDIEKLAAKINKFYHVKDDQLYYLKMECPYVNQSFEQKYHTRNRVVRDDNIQIYKSTYRIRNSVLNESTNPYTAQYIQNVDCLSCYSYYQIELDLDTTADTKNGAIFSILSTILVILVLFLGTSTITSSMEELMLHPLRDALLALSTEAWSGTEKSKSKSSDHVKGKESEGTIARPPQFLLPEAAEFKKEDEGEGEGEALKSFVKPPEERPGSAIEMSFVNTDDQRRYHYGDDQQNIKFQNHPLAFLT